MHYSGYHHDGAFHLNLLIRKDLSEFPIVGTNYAIKTGYRNLQCLRCPLCFADMFFETHRKDTLEEDHEKQILLLAACCY